MPKKDKAISEYNTVVESIAKITIILENLRSTQDWLVERVERLSNRMGVE